MTHLPISSPVSHTHQSVCTCTLLNVPAQLRLCNARPLTLRHSACTQQEPIRNCFRHGRRLGRGTLESLPVRFGLSKTWHICSSPLPNTATSLKSLAPESAHGSLILNSAE